jgi:hypothetical protein
MVFGLPGLQSQAHAHPAGCLGVCFNAPAAGNKQ